VCSLPDRARKLRWAGKWHVWVTKEIIKQVRDMVLDDRRMKVREIAETTCITAL